MAYIPIPELSCCFLGRRYFSRLEKGLSRPLFSILSGGLFSGSRINGLCFPSTSRGNKCAVRAPTLDETPATRHPPRPPNLALSFGSSGHNSTALLGATRHTPPLHTFQCITYAGISIEATTIPVLWRVPSTSHLSMGLYFPPLDSRRLSTTCCHRSVPSHKRAQNEPSYPQKITNDEEPAR